MHKDTGVKSYFGIEDPSIVDGIMSYPSWMYVCSEVQLQSGAIGLGGGCFYECRELTSITLPEGVTSIGEYCFYSCTNLTSITLPIGVNSLGEGCFMFCSSLTSISIPESVTNLGPYCFTDCSSLTLATVLPATPPTLGGDAFTRVHKSLNIKVRSPYVNAYKTATNWKTYAAKISAI